MNRGVFAAVLCLTLAACSKGPDAVVEDFHESVEAGDYDRAIDLLSPELANMMGRDKLRAALASQSSQIAQCGGIANIYSEIDGDKAVQRGTVTITFRGECEPKVENVRLVKMNDEWKLAADK